MVRITMIKIEKNVSMNVEKPLSEFSNLKAKKINSTV